jgi:hypothetical protein
MGSCLPALLPPFLARVLRTATHLPTLPLYADLLTTPRVELVDVIFAPSPGRLQRQARNLLMLCHVQKRSRQPWLAVAFVLGRP